MLNVRCSLLLSLVIILLLAAAPSCTNTTEPSKKTATATQPATRASLADDTIAESTRFATAKSLGFSYAPSPTNDGSRKRSDANLAANSASCLTCHTTTDAHTMHRTPVRLGCADCHGGNPAAAIPANLQHGSAAYKLAQAQAHVTPKLPDLWRTSANPSAPGARTLLESADFIRFVNPGDLRSAPVACASCHEEIVRKVEKSMMAHGAMLWEAALYNNGAINRKNPIYGESYTTDGVAQKLTATSRPTTRESKEKGHLSALWPLPRWEISQPGNILRVFEEGAERRPIIGVPDPLDLPGRPDSKLSVRGFGTDVRTDPVFLGLQKTRLLDPTLNLFGTNDHPGDYRASGCSACHVVYANDRSPIHSAFWSNYGNRGQSFSKDPTVGSAPRTTNPSTNPMVRNTDPTGHPIEHRFVKSMPTSTCIVCHIHPGTNVLNSYLGYMWWDNESDGEFMYPRRQMHPTATDEAAVSLHNPEQAAARGLWSNHYPNEFSHASTQPAGPDFLERLPDLNPLLKHNYFADFHGHGWVFRAVWKQDRHGNLLDSANNIVTDVSSEKLKKGAEYQWHKLNDTPPVGVPVHLKDIHLEMGMSCVDCHFSQDSHGDGNLYGETRNAVMAECVDCHGSAEGPSKLAQFFRLPAIQQRQPRNQDLLRTAFTGKAAPDPTTLQGTAFNDWLKFINVRFAYDRASGKLVQKSALYAEDPQKAKAAGMSESWLVSQIDSAAPPPANAPHDAAKRTDAARYAHTMRKNGDWGAAPPPTGADEQSQLAHSSSKVSCYACHTSWNTSCFGCHLPMRANQRKPMLHDESAITRNYTNYNYQTLRDDVYMLGIDSSVKGNKVVPIRSACAVLVSSQDANRQWIYAQQQTVSAEGFAGTAFSPYFPHTVRTTETKKCTDCHLSKDGDNNAILAQLLLLGTNSVNFIGRFAWVGEGKHGLEAVAVTEREEPQAVIGSRLHELAYPDYFSNHQKSGLKLTESQHHEGTILDLQLRGEYLYAACGPDGFIAYDVANIDNKGLSERIITAPVSPLGQRFYIKSKYATCITSPSTMALDPTRPHLADNEEQSVHPLYAFLYLTDREEGLIVIGDPKTGVATLLDGNPSNNYLTRALTFNPGGLLNGAAHLDLWGHYAYVSCDAGLVILDLDDPHHPKHVGTLSDGLKSPRRVAFQFRYGFVGDAEGIKVIRMDDPAHPVVVARVEGINDPRDIYLCRTYAYVAAGAQGLAILDIERPESPKLVEFFIVDPSHPTDPLNDVTAVRIGMTNISLFAYVADGKNGLRVLQLTSASDKDNTPGFMGFSPRPHPRLIASYKTKGPAIALSEGLDRDRAVDETGHQLAVFGRRGARPMNLAEQQRLYIRPTASGERELFMVADTPDPVRDLAKKK